MKPNVDLTLNREFRDNNKFSIIEEYILDNRFIWDDVKHIVNSDEDFNGNELFFTGDKSERRVKKYNEMRENTCDKCGTLLGKFPWVYYQIEHSN